MKTRDFLVLSPKDVAILSTRGNNTASYYSLRGLYGYFVVDSCETKLSMLSGIQE